MTDYFNTQDRSNKAVVASAADFASQLTSQLADKLRRHRKVNSGTPVPAKPAAPWYRRFDKH